jgi:hypothetical protein
MTDRQQRLIKPPSLEDLHLGCGAADEGVAERLRQMIGPIDGISRLTTPSPRPTGDRHPYRPFEPSEPKGDK